MNQNFARKGAFTLVEMLVAIAVLSILLSVVFVPLRLGISSYHIGSSRTAAQNAAQASLDDMDRDFRRAAYVFPNTALVGVTDKAPYTNNQAPGAAATDPGFPYTRSTDSADVSNDATTTPAFSTQKGVCERTSNPSAIPWGNTSRVDMILAKKDASGRVILPVQLGDTIVTYYARRQRMGADAPYSPVDNPVVLFRVEIPFRDASGNTLVSGMAGSPPNADISQQRLGTSGACSAGTTTRGSLWLAHNANGEANLEPLTEPPPSGAQTPGGAQTSANGVQTLAIPRGIGLVDSQAYKVDPTSSTYNLGAIDYKKEAPLVPDTSFQLSDTNGDGKIDQVSASLALEIFDANQGAATGANNQPTGQIVRARRVFDLPNVR